MANIDQIRQLYQSYLEQAREAERKHRPGEGLWGFGRKTSDAPCHDRFIKDLESCVARMAGEAPPSAPVREALEYIYRAPREHRDPLAVYWMLLAAHGLTLDLIPLLDPADAGALWEWYRKTYPRWDRLPAQEKVLAALKSRSAE